MTKPAKAKNKKAQTATELAIFGGVLMFVISAIVNQSLSSSYYQNQSYRAMRMALSMSFKHAEGAAGGRLYEAGRIQGNISHNSASVLLVEDRLSARSAKHAAVDRTPHMVMGSGTYSRNLLMSVSPEFMDEWEYQLPIVDIYVNGQHFPFSTARLKKVCLLSASDCVPMTPDITGRPAHIYNTATHNDWLDIPGGSCGWTEDVPTATVNCSVLYGKESKAGLSSHFCTPSVCIDECVWTTTYPYYQDHPAACNLSVDDRFTLERSDMTHIVPATPQDIRDTFSWQWIMYLGIVDGFEWKAYKACGASKVTATTKTPNGVPGIKKGAMVDVDRDGNMESVMDLEVESGGTQTPPGYCSNFFDHQYTPNPNQGRVNSVVVMDGNDGDVDFSEDGIGVGPPKPGFDKTVHMFTKVLEDDAIYLVEEGELYTLDHQHVRSAQRKNQVDWIQRRFQLTNNTGRFCYLDGSGNIQRTTYVGDRGACGGDCTQNPLNPVEVCCASVLGKGCSSGGPDCFDSSNSVQNVLRTCLELGDVDRSIPVYPELWIRSRIRGRQGRKWVTEVTSDTYIDL